MATAILLAASLGAYYLQEPAEVPDIGSGATVYYNEACGDCAIYLRDDLIPTLEAAGYSNPQVKDYINERRYRAELNDLTEQLEIPTNLQAHMATFIGGDHVVVLEGHVPPFLILDALALSEGDPDLSLLVVYQESMGEAERYRVWTPTSPAAECDIDVPLASALAGDGATCETTEEQDLLPLVIVSGLLDGINPCAIAILLFFLALLFVLRRTRGNVARMGTLYIYAIFLAYFLIGLGLLYAIVLVEGQMHFMAKVGAFLVLFLGVLTLLHLLFPRLPLITKAPKVSFERVKERMVRATLPSAFVAGFLVGLCTFPCSGGIYVAILSLLASKTTYIEGLGYLYLYNLMFIMPLVAILVATGNRMVARRMAQWERSNTKFVKLVSGLAMVGVGLVILLWFV